ncbi:hypothetical protein [Paenibacillus polymyxa]|uniref:hypothetical protein n=1 Tax=Paenibacillus polymyxa TaxID=1406 RepID=UPI002AB41F93|nr:hypothetical protein [Paenibacillus polymyxa]MDY8025510.1 hypothetical protein [Paenibacillus polymyxa]
MLEKKSFKVTLMILSVIISIILLFIVYVTQVEKRSIQSKVIEISMSLSGLKNESTQFKEKVESGKKWAGDTNTSNQMN